MTRALVVQHEDPCPTAWLGQWLLDDGVELDVVAAHRGQPVPPDLRGYEGLVVLGGAMSAGDDDRCPWLPATKELVRVAVLSGTPMLGICLGHQLTALALGGAVEPSAAGMTRGVVPVRLTDEGGADPLLAGCDGLPAVHWNRDVATGLPSGATVLATAPDGTVQAARFGERAWGVQFHPEASAAVVAGWAVPRAPGVPVPAHVQAAADAVAAAEESLRVAWRPLARRFSRLLEARRA